MAGIFISYRREEGSWAGRIYDRLRQEYSPGEVFIDIDHIDLGDNFVETIKERVAQSDVVLVIIGPKWLARAPQLHNRSDMVRIEIETAVSYNIRTIPVYVDNISSVRPDILPPELKQFHILNGVILTHAHFEAGMASLFNSIKLFLPVVPKSNPFAGLWLVVGAILNITGLAHVVGDVVKWAGFFRDIWKIYRTLIRDPIRDIVLLVWPSWLLEFPTALVDWFVLWSGVWIAINIYHYQVSGTFKLAAIFWDTTRRVSDAVFVRTRLYWMIVELVAMTRGAIELVYQYVTLPVKYFYYAALNRSPLGEPLAIAQRKKEILRLDLNAVRHWMTSYAMGIYNRKTDPPQLSTLPQEATPEFRHDPLGILRKVRSELQYKYRALDTKIERHYLFIAARRVMAYYLSIVLVFICVLFINYTLLSLGLAKP